MSALRHACAEVARLAERIGEETTPVSEVPTLMTQLRLVVARVELLVGGSEFVGLAEIAPETAIKIGAPAAEVLWEAKRPDSET